MKKLDLEILLRDMDYSPIFHVSIDFNGNIQVFNNDVEKVFDEIESLFICNVGKFNVLITNSEDLSYYEIKLFEDNDYQVY